MSNSKGTILITGASGYIAAHVLESFLEAGYHVRGTVRSQASAANVEKSHAKWGSKLSFAIVPKIEAPGAFDEAVKGVDGVIHTQSPFALAVEDNERDLLIPAIQGTVGLLESVQKHNPSVKRVVITSSLAAILDLSKGLRPGYTYTDDDWNPATYEEGRDSNATVAYCVSKVLAEKAAWDYVKEKKPNFDISVICAVVVYGPNAHHIDSLSRLGESSTMFYSLMNGSRSEVPPTGFPVVVDVRDLGVSHRLAYEIPAAGGERYLVGAQTFSFQDICRIIRAEFPELRDRVPEPVTAATPAPPTYDIDNSKVRKQLGLEFRSLKETVVDSVRNFLELEKTLGSA